MNSKIDRLFTLSFLLKNNPSFSDSRDLFVPGKNFTVERDKRLRDVTHTSPKEFPTHVDKLQKKSTFTVTWMKFNRIGLSLKLPVEF